LRAGRGHFAAVVAVPHLVFVEDVAEPVPLRAALQRHGHHVVGGADAALVEHAGIGIGAGADHGVNRIGAPHGRIVALGALRTGVVEVERERDDFAFAHEPCRRDDVLGTGVVERADLVIRPPLAPILVFLGRVAEVLARDFIGRHWRSFFAKGWKRLLLASGWSRAGLTAQPAPAMIASTKRSREDAVAATLRALACLAATLCALSAPGQTGAEDYPARPVRWIVPFGAGGPTDVIARIVAQKLSESWGQQVVTENIPGAGGNTGVAMAARASPDGYTMLVVSTGFMVNPSMYAKIPYDPIKDFAPVTLVAASPNVISVHPDFPAKTLKELIELVSSHPGKYSFAQPSTGSTPHLAGELFKQKYRLDLVTVPFNSAALAINSTIGAHTPIAFTALPPAMTNIKEGKLRGLAVLSARRVAALPEVPTNLEAGVPDLESDTLTGIVAPAGTPRDIIDRWRGDIAKAVAATDVKERLQGLGFAPVANTPEEFGARIKAEIAKWGKVVHDANIRAN